jgi:hypothetical protein
MANASTPPSGLFGNPITGKENDPIKPGGVTIGNPGGVGTPYVNTGGKVGAQTVRATGQGPGDAGWRQNLATYSGGQFERPGGMFSFNPTSTNPFGGQPVGGGNAPVLGAPSTLLQHALGLNSMTMQQMMKPPAPATTPTGSPGSTEDPSGNWLDDFMSQGSMVNPQ